KDGKYGMSDLMQNYVAGLLKYAPEITYFLAPNINSYKRFCPGTFAPTKSIWSLDNRTAGYRLCGANTKGIRMECRVGGADLNPHLAFAALLAAGIRGIKEKLELEPEFVGDAYAPDSTVQEIPTTLREATVVLDGSEMLRSAFGDDVVDHYVHAARHEQSEFDKCITDWEINRGFERG
ncbi:MAG: glutamine synthetase, partial [Emcibacteraceae bacterium]|nr:glutamine synthetase [Emcibacteraceae bacterium]